METTKENEAKVLDFLDKELAAGKKWLVYEAGSVIKSPEDLHCFKSEDDARQYAHDNTSDFDRMIAETIKTFLETIKTNIMNTLNLEYLQTNLKYFGFGDKLNEALEKNIRDDKTEFQLKVEIPHFNNKMDYTLHFKKSSQSDMYFFNRYDAALQNGNPELDKSQAFYVNKGHGITAKEAFNLLEGRSVFKELVNKEGEKYNAWLKLDFENSDPQGNHKMKLFTEQYGYNLEKTLANYPIKEMGDSEQKKQLLNSLEKGNVQQVTMKPDGREAKYYIEAVPQFKNINIYDQKMHMVRRQNVQDFKVGEGQGEGQKPAKKQEQKMDADDGHPGQKQPRKRKLSL
jgi:hypothetical protein